MKPRRLRLLVLATSRERASYRLRVEAIVTRPDFPFEVSGRLYAADWQSPNDAMAVARRAREADVVLNARVLLDKPVLEALAQARTPVVFDYDDALYAVPSSTLASNYRIPLGWAKLLVRWLLYGRPNWSRLRRSLILNFSYCAAVSAGNPQLATVASRFCAATFIVPTTVDVRQLPLKEVNTGRPVTIGWYGSPDNHWYLRQIVPALKQMTQRCGKDVRLQVISATPFSQRGLNVESILWQPDSEVAQLLAFDIGLMPLSDDEWARGKSAAKAIYYMALGIPAVVSPVGVNSIAVPHGLTGYHARDTRDWVTALSRLVESVDLRRNLGQNARAHVEAHYSAETAVEKLSTALHAAMNTDSPLGATRQRSHPL